MKSAFTSGPLINFDGRFIKCKDVQLSVQPLQRPHPPMWLETRDAPTLEFCAEQGLHTGYFLLFPTKVSPGTLRALPRGLEAARLAGDAEHRLFDRGLRRLKPMRWRGDKALADAGRAYKGFFSYSDDPGEIRARQLETAAYFRERNEPGSAEIILKPAGSPLPGGERSGPDRLARHRRAQVARLGRGGSFNTFFGEFNFGAMPEADLMRSIRLFATEVSSAGATSSRSRQKSRGRRRSTAHPGVLAAARRIGASLRRRAYH